MIRNYQKGGLLIQVLILSFVAFVLISGIMNWSKTNLEASRQAITRERSIQLAEAGIDYYRWHLAHAQTDYQDGTGAAGPYVHTVYDKDGNVTGEFSLNITAPISGSTKVIIESTGKSASSNIIRKIKVEMAIPSLAKYAVVANDVMRFGEGTEVFGPIHSNNGIHFDGYAHNTVTSAVASYDDPDHSGGVEFGVHTHMNNPTSGGSNSSYRPQEAPPNPVADRPDVFGAGRQFPVPAVDFIGITSDLAEIKTKAQASGNYYSPSGSQGYQIILKTNDTYDLYRVNSQTNTFSNNCIKQSNGDTTLGWGSWTINTKTLVGNYTFPSNGLIFVEDNVWVEGTINTARITIASGRFPDNPSNRPNIIINNSINYTNKDGQDVISLIAQGNVTAGFGSADIIDIDAALIAQNGRVGRFYYASQCGAAYVRDTLTLYGMIASNGRYGFAYTDGSGYETRNIIYDANLLYSPPPSFPLTSDQYEILSWEEVY